MIGNLLDVYVVQPLDGALSTIYQMVHIPPRTVWRSIQSDLLAHHLSEYSYRVPFGSLSNTSRSPLKIPLSAFILQDMDELVQAHATYRFVLLDEEEEKPRMLVCTFFHLSLYGI